MYCSISNQFEIFDIYRRFCADHCLTGHVSCFSSTQSLSWSRACMYAGINISGTNGEVMPGQCEFRVSPSVGIEAGDHVWCARYLLEKTGSKATIGKGNVQAQGRFCFPCISS
ncbi:glutamine synthetase, chloroplastic isoform X2 [Spinacia oleracea]|uniref:Glutamate--ammonia ligase n=1 Tax=Spinacia oleracea TaxID=3562 RepID=A0A9R0ITY2_SPIOL|nr:glutamine synthetase, chloroplastic-like isoform X2 [Spinacia oleracea]